MLFKSASYSGDLELQHDNECLSLSLSVCVNNVTCFVRVVCTRSSAFNLTTINFYYFVHSYWCYWKCNLHYQYM